MLDLSLLPYAAASLSVGLALASLLRKRSTNAVWYFFTGMLLLATDAVLVGLAIRAASPHEIVRWITLAFGVKCAAALVWLCFSLTYSRADRGAVLTRWRAPAVIVALMPMALAAWFPDQFFQLVRLHETWGVQLGIAARTLNVLLLLPLVLILANMEQTFRAAIGTMRWRIKFVVLAVAVIFGARLYVRVQAILFSAPDLTYWAVESGALVIACVFLAVAYARTGLSEIHVYPSRAVLRSSLTIVLVGAYLLVVGVVAQVVARFGGREIFQFQSLVVLAGMAGLAVLLLSDRARQKLHRIAVGHFGRAQHDSIQTWSMFSRRLASVKDLPNLANTSARLISEAFNVLSVTVWLMDDETGRLMRVGSTSTHVAESGTSENPPQDTRAVVAALATRSLTFDLDEATGGWAEQLRQLNPTGFANGGHRWCVPLRSAEQIVGMIILADRVSGAVYSVEELELFTCIGDQVASLVINLRLAGDVARARELEAFRTMSAFFVHDLKNAAASLNLMLKNLPIHFDDPAFREDALRAVGNTCCRIDQIIARLTALRQRPELLRAEADLNQLVGDALDRVKGLPDVEIAAQLEPVPPILADREQIQSVITNLVLNAGDAVGANGRIRVRTEHADGTVMLSITDNGCGMSQEFVRDSLFRPFQSTKKQGLGIGLFQSRAIVQAHGGRMEVESEPGKGTTFLVSLPSRRQM